MKKPILFAIFLVGFTAMSAQIVFLRQLIVVFYGNEISLGVILGGWLFWGAVGSWLLGRFSDRIKNRQFYFSVLQIVLSFILVGIIFIIRNSRTILDISPGEIVGFLPIAGFSFFVPSLICIILGFLFALACRIYPTLARKLSSCTQEKDKGGVYPQKETGAARIGKVYILEASGAVCGGCLISFLFIRYFDAFYILFGLAFLNLLSAYFLQYRLKQPKGVLVTKGISLILVLFLVFLLFSQKGKQIKDFSIRQQWRHFNLLTAENSIYSNLALTGQKGEYSFFSNGLYLFTVPDVISSEEAVHFALLETPEPKRVLLVGGGIGGLAKEILKHPVSALDYVELDPRIIKLGQQYLPEERLKFLEDSRVNVHYQDGRLFIKQYLLLPAKRPYDTIIIYLGDPYTAQINRFYTLEFFREVKKCLAPFGVFSFGLSSSENFLNVEQQQFLSSIYKTLRTVFKEVEVIPGDTAYFLATDEEGLLTYDYKELTQRLKKREVQTEFVHEYYLFAKLSKDRIKYLQNRLKEEKKAKLNTDFRPVSYYYDMVLWSTYFARPWRKVFSHINTKNIWAFFSLIYLSILASGLLRRNTSDVQSKATILAISTTGFTELTFQVVILLSFQIIYGYLYYKLGIILSSFMIGLVLGSWLVTKKLEKIKGDYTLFIKTQVAVSIYLIILPLIFSALSKITPTELFNWAGSNIIFPGLPIISGFIGGFQFPLANKIILKNKDIVGRTAGLTYGMDLLGSCTGAFLVSAFFIPILGINQTCVAVALLNTAVLAVLIINRKR